MKKIALKIELIKIFAAALYVSIPQALNKLTIDYYNLFRIK